MKISVVTPVFKSSKSLKALYERLEKSLSSITHDFEIIMVNDFSPDDCWEIIKTLAQKDRRVKGINLSKNFGQHHAITAGLDYAFGDWVVVMDCDLQDKPEEIIKLHSKAQEGYDIVFGRRVNRQDGFIKKIGSKVFYKIYNYFTDSNTDHTIANFSILKQKVVKEFRRFKEQNRSYYLFVNRLGFKRVSIDLEHSKRHEGKSSYTIKKLVNLAIDSIVTHSNKPLRLSIKFGFGMTFCSAVFAIWLVIKYIVFSIPIAGWTSLMVSLYFIGGLLFANMGILGLYIGKIFDETKNRPLYIISEMTF